MMSCYINTERVTSAGVSVMQFASRPRQLPFASAATVPVLCIITTSQVSVTKAVGP